MKIKIYILAIIILFIFISCASKYSYVRVDEVISKPRTIAVASFTFPKSMTNQYYDRLKYLNTEIYTDFVLNSFISNFNSQNEMIKLVTLKEAIGDNEFAALPSEYHYVLGADYVAATGTLAVDGDVFSILRDKLKKGEVQSLKSLLILKNNKWDENACKEHLKEVIDLYVNYYAEL